MGQSFKEMVEALDDDLALLLKGFDDAKSLVNLSNREKDEFCIMVLRIVKDVLTSNNSENFSKLNDAVELFLLFLQNGTDDVQKNPKVVQILEHLNKNELVITDISVRNSISKLNEYWIVKLHSPEEIAGMEYFTLKHLLQICLAEKPLVGDIQRLSAIRKFVTSAPFEKMVPSLRPSLIKLAQSSVVIASEHGQRFLAYMITLSHKLMSDIHKTIMLELNSCNKKKGTQYGKMYVNAWHNASDEMKTALEKTCYQHLMESFLKGQRTSLNLTKPSQNMLAVLEIWHSERKKNHSQFVTMITDAYQPILWKYLKSGFNVHRCNAADLFFKAFPLQRPCDNVMDAERLFNEQYDAMLASLKDDCHIVRIIAIREICNILSHYWNSFTSSQIQKLMTVLIKDNANDASTAEGRRMVYIGLQSFVKNPLSFEYLKEVMPALADNVHDVNFRVRIAFIQLLIAIKEKKDPNFKYSSCVPMFSLYYRLALDNINVGQWIVKLLISNYYQPNMPVVEWTKRFIFLIKTYRKSYRNFFFYSVKVLPLEDAFTIICELLTQIGVYVISKSTCNQENEEVAEIKPNSNKKRKTKKNPLSDVNGTEKEVDNTQDKTKECAFDDPVVVTGLFDIVSILWVLHDNKLNLPENEEKRLKLYDTYLKYAQPFINYYKDTAIFISVLSLSGNIPASLLRSNSITLPGYCIKTLKSIKFNKSEENNETVVSMLIALVKWGRGSEILEQVLLWLDAAFETQDMNDSILPRRRVKISETIEPDSVVAIHILDTLLKIEYVRQSILKKNYNQLFELWKFMSRIKSLIETRLEQGEPFTEDLVSDQFLKLCFRRFVKLIPLLKEEVEKTENEEKEKDECVINHQKEMEDVIEWSNIHLFTLLNQDLNNEDLELVAHLLNDVLYVADNMIIIHTVKSPFYYKLGHFILKLLNTKYKLYFLKSASRIALVLNFTAKTLFNVNDDLNLFSTVVPSIVSHILDIISCKDVNIEDIKEHEQDLPAIKSNLTKILNTYQDNFKTKTSSRESAKQLQLMVGFFVETIVTLISYEIPRPDNSVPLYSTVNQLPFVAGFLTSMFYNKNFWGPMFVHVLNTKLSAKQFECKSLIASILILYLYSSSDGKMNEVELKKALNSAMICLKKEKNNLARKDSGKDGSFTVESEKDGGTSDGPTNTDRAIWGSREMEKRPSGENDWMPEPESTPTPNVTLSRENFDEDLIECGFELLLTAENLLNKKAENV